jgi:hypothetical protein
MFTAVNAPRTFQTSLRREAVGRKGALEKKNSL